MSSVSKILTDTWVYTPNDINISMIIAPSGFPQVCTNRSCRTRILLASFTSSIVSTGCYSLKKQLCRSCKQHLKVLICPFLLISKAAKWFSTGGNFGPRGPFSMSGDIFGCLPNGGRGIVSLESTG